MAGPNATPEALKTLRMDGYPFDGGHPMDLATTILEVTGAVGGKASMPPEQHGMLEQHDRQLIQDWADAVFRANYRELSPQRKAPPAGPSGGGHHQH
jgi:hypothetical protein